MRLIWALATLLGIALLAWLVRSAGLDVILAAARRLGVGGFALVCAASIGLFLLLGAAWAAAAGEPARRIPLFSLARLVREAAADFLPFSQIGGLAAGARIIRIGGIAPPRIYASMIADQTTEMASQAIFSLVGVATAAAVLAGGREQAAFRMAVIGGTAALAAFLIAFLFGQRRFLRLAAGLSHRILPGLSSLLGETETELARLYAQKSRIVASFAWNLLAWLAMAGVAWLILLLIGSPLAVWRLVAIESAIAAVRSVAFLVPGALGVQEAAYALVGPLFGLPMEAAIILSLVKRARDGALAIFSLLSWQAAEIGALARRKHAAGAAESRMRLPG